MKILALDISSRNTGWSVYENSKPIAVGEISGTADTHAEKLHNYRVSLDHIINKYEPELVAIEDAWSGKNKLTFKILSYYHGVTLELVGKYKTKLSIMMPSRFRRLVGAVYNRKLNFADREAAKLATSSLMQEIGFATSNDSEDICDAVAIGLAADLWHNKFNQELDLAKDANKKIRSIVKLNKLATDSTEKYFKGLEKANEKSLGNTRSK